VFMYANVGVDSSALYWNGVSSEGESDL